MVMKRAKKALPEVIPLRICVTFRRATFRSWPKRSKSWIWDDQVENTTNTDLKRHDNFLENLKNHENRSKLDPYSTNRAENQGFWICKVLPIQWDPSRSPKLLYKIQNRTKIQQTPSAKVYTKLFRSQSLGFMETFDDWSVMRRVGGRQLGTLCRTGKLQKWKTWC